MDLLEKAIAVALDAHHGQEMRSGLPYILHPLHLMMQMESEEEMITAVLHDVLEDSAYTAEELRSLGFSEEVLRALELLTHEKGETSYQEYIAALKSNPLAVRVKLADLEHNMDISRLPAPLDERDLLRLQRYRHAWETLTGE